MSKRKTERRIGRNKATWDGWCLTPLGQQLALHGYPPKPNGGLRLAAHILVKAGKRHPAVARLARDEIDSEAYLIVCKAAATWNPDKALFSTWIGWQTRAAVTRICSAAKKVANSPFPLSDLGMDEDKPLDPEDARDDNEVIVDMNHHRHKVAEVKRRLLPLQWATLWMVCAEERTLEEVGRLTGVTKERVRQRVKEIKQLLQRSALVGARAATMEAM